MNNTESLQDKIERLRNFKDHGLSLVNIPKLKQTDKGFDEYQESANTRERQYKTCFTYQKLILMPARVTQGITDRNQWFDIEVEASTYKHTRTRRKPFDDVDFTYKGFSTRTLAIDNTSREVFRLKDVVGVGKTINTTAGEQALNMGRKKAYAAMNEEEREVTVFTKEPEVSQESYVHYNALQATWHIIFKDLETYHPTRNHKFYFPVHVYQEQRGRYQAKILLGNA